MIIPAVIIIAIISIAWAVWSLKDVKNVKETRLYDPDKNVYGKVIFDRQAKAGNLYASTSKDSSISTDT